MNPVVLDIFHGDEVTDWDKVCGAGIRGVILKASQGYQARDPTFHERREAAQKAGLLVGAYHFLTSNDVVAQVDNFLGAVGDTVGLLLALDYEDNKAATASLEQAKHFLQLVYERTGQRPVLYSGDLIKSQLQGPDPFLNSHRLWLCEYGPRAKLPPGWDSYWLWQYTGDGIGPKPNTLPGVATKGIDLNVFGGADLAAEWAPTLTAAALAAPHPAVVVARHPITLALGGLVAMWQHALSGVTGYLHDTFSGVDLKQVVGDTREMLDPATDLLGILHARTPQIELMLGILCVAFVLFHIAFPAKK
jgi:GH25 family lysozyme M1 (1,4-beta-N-acetylmuramidase)